jgi:hypothetical protein
VSCSDVGNISIMEKLPIVELNKMIESDSMYSFSSERVKALNQFATTLDSAKFYKITHKSFSEFLSKEKYVNDLYDDDELKKGYVDKWENKYGKYRIQADSIVNYWKDRLEKEGNVDRFIKIEPESIYRSLLRFRLTNQTNQTVSLVQFKYNVTSKNENNLIKYYDGIEDRRDFASVVSYKKFNKSILFVDDFSITLPSSDYVNLYAKSIDEVNKKYRINIYPTSLFLDGVEYKPLSISDLPKEVSGYLKYTERSKSDDYYQLFTDLYLVDIINNHLNLDFEVPQIDEEFDEYLDNLLKEDFPLEFEYYYNMLEKEDKF